MVRQRGVNTYAVELHYLHDYSDFYLDFKYLSDLLNKHAPKKNIYVVDRPLNGWMIDDILTLKAIRRKNELIWRKTRTTVNFDIYYNNNNNNCLKSNIQCIEIRVQWTVHLGSSHITIIYDSCKAVKEAISV